MVASGLAERVEVSQYRLATHLLLACMIYIALIWTAWRSRERAPLPAAGRIRATAVALLSGAAALRDAAVAQSL
jgi:heme a synthase